MGVEVPQEESVILGVEEIIEGGRGIAGPGGDRRDVDVEDVEGSVIDGGPDCEVFCLGVIGEERVGVYGGVLDGVMDEDDETTPASRAGAVATEGEEVIKWFELGSRSQFGLLDAGYEDGLGMKEGVEFCVGVGDAIDVDLEDGIGVTRGFWWRGGRSRGSRGSVETVW